MKKITGIIAGIVFLSACRNEKPQTRLSDFMIGSWHSTGEKEYRLTFTKDSLEFSREGNRVWNGPYRLNDDSTLYFNYGDVDTRKIDFTEDSVFAFKYLPDHQPPQVSINIIDAMRYKKEIEK